MDCSEHFVNEVYVEGRDFESGVLAVQKLKSEDAPSVSDFSEQEFRSIVKPSKTDTTVHRRFMLQLCAFIFVVFL